MIKLYSKINCGLAPDSAVVEVQEMFNSRGGHLTNEMYHHDPAFLLTFYTDSKQIG